MKYPMNFVADNSNNTKLIVHKEIDLIKLGTLNALMYFL